MAPFRTVAIIGASGVLGQPVTRQLAKAGYNLTLISRDSAKLKQTFGSLNGVKYVAAEPSDSNRLTEAFKGKVSWVPSDRRNRCCALSHWFCCPGIAGQLCRCRRESRCQAFHSK